MINFTLGRDEIILIHHLPQRYRDARIHSKKLTKSTIFCRSWSDFSSALVLDVLSHQEKVLRGWIGHSFPFGFAFHDDDDDDDGRERKGVGVVCWCVLTSWEERDERKGRECIHSLERGKSMSDRGKVVSWGMSEYQLAGSQFFVQREWLSFSQFRKRKSHTSGTGTFSFLGKIFYVNEKNDSRPLELEKWF